jgi:hypothetical protein
MAQLSIPDIIDLGDISTPLALNYQADGSLFGPRKTYTAATTIALVTDALRWQWEGFPDITEVRATSTITIDTIGEEGQTITVTVNDPILGNISLGSYTITSSDTTVNITATNIANALSNNSYGYGISVTNDEITITAGEFLGSSINGITPVCTITNVFFISTESDDIITTENNINLITE